MDKLRDVLARHPRGVTLYELSALLQVGPRTMRRYLKEIEREFELMPTRPRGGGPSLWRIRPSELPRKVEMRRAQAYALLATRRVFEPFRGSALYDEIELAVAKLMAFAERPGRGPNAGRANTALADRFLYIPAQRRDYSEKVEAIDELFQAVLELRPVAFKYRDVATAKEERVSLHPCGLVLHCDEVYCVGQAVGHAVGQSSRYKTFLLDRMRDVRTMADQHFQLPPGFNVEAEFCGEFGPNRDAETITVVIELRPSLAKQMRGVKLHPSQEVMPIAGGCSRFKVSVEDPLSLLTRILGWGSAARVLEPSQLRERVQQEHAAALSLYSSC